MAENYGKPLNNKKKSNIESYSKFIDEGFKKLFLKKIKGKLNNNHVSSDRKKNTPNIMKSMVIQPLHKRQSQPHRSKTKDLRTLSPLLNSQNYQVTDEGDKQITIDNQQNYFTKADTIKRQNFHLREFNTSTLNDNNSVSKKTPLNLDFIKFKYNSSGNINENKNIYLDNFKSYCHQLKLKMQLDEGDSFHDDKVLPETDRNHLKSTDSISSFENSKQILKLINNLKQIFEKQGNNQMIYSSNAMKQNNGRNSTPLKDRSRNNNAVQQKNRNNSNKCNQPDEKEDSIIESLDKLKDYVESTDKKLCDIKYYYKQTINFLLKQVSDFMTKEKKYIQEINNLKSKYNVLLQEYQLENKIESNPNVNQISDNNKEKVTKVIINIKKNKLNRYINKRFSPFTSYISLLKQIGLEQSIFFKESEMVNVQNDNLSDNCDCFTYEDRIIYYNKDKCGQDNVFKWNSSLFLENSKLRSFLEMLSEKINHDNAYRMIIEDKYVKGKLKPLMIESSEPKHKIFSRIPKHINNISMISWVKSDTGKETIDNKEDSILKEIQC